MDLKKLEVLLRAADNGYVDLCFFSLIRSGPFEYIDLVDDPMMVVLYPGHPLTKKRAIALEDLKDEPLLLATNPRGLDYDVAKVLSEASFTPRIEATSNLDHIIFSMVQHHLGISIEAALMLTDKENAAVLRPFDPPQSRRLVMAARSVPHALPRRQPVCQPHEGGAAENGAGSDPVLILNCITIRGQTLCLPRMVFKYVLFTTRLRVPLLPKPIWLQQQ